jgi:hypothetical protein
MSVPGARRRPEEIEFTRWKGSLQQTNDSATTLLFLNLLAIPHFDETISQEQEFPQ